MTDPMTPEELKACRERAEAATPGPWEMSRRDDVMGGFDYFVEAGPLCVAVAAEDARPTRGMGAKRDAAFIAHARTDVPRLLATVDHAEARAERAEAALASLRHAALFAAGVRGGPGAWRWAHDKRGTILDDAAAWERLLGEMRDLGSVEALRKLRWSVVANAGRLSLRGPAPRWSHVMRAAGLGSTSAKALCVAAGFDPDEEIGKWPEPCETCAEEEEDEEGEDE